MSLTFGNGSISRRPQINIIYLPCLNRQSNSVKCELLSITRFGLAPMSDIDSGTVIEKAVVLLNETNAVLKGEYLLLFNYWY